nr:RICIn superfamily protein [Mimivirus sp.]
MFAAPLNSGYAIFSTDCNFSGSKSMAIIGDYSIKISNNNNWIRNTVAPDSKYTNPLIQLGDNSIASVAIGPYTKIILFAKDNYMGNNKIIENNSSNQSTHNLCKDNYSQITSSIRISYSELYVGYGLEPYTGQQYKYQSFVSNCQPSSQYRTLENFENYASNSNKWMSMLLILFIIIIIIVVIVFLTRKKICSSVNFVI